MVAEVRALVHHALFRSGGRAHRQASSGCRRPRATILVRRGYDTPDAARAFLTAEDRHDPLALGQMAEACELILRHARLGLADRRARRLRRRRRVVHRDPRARAATARRPRLAGTCQAGSTTATDCRFRPSSGSPPRAPGCSSRSTARSRRWRRSSARSELGLDVVVTDHHRPGETLPPCPVVHPALGGYPFTELCAAGVAHKLAEALYARRRARPVARRGGSRPGGAGHGGRRRVAHGREPAPGARRGCRWSRARPSRGCVR